MSSRFYTSQCARSGKSWDDAKFGVSTPGIAVDSIYEGNVVRRSSSVCLIVWITGGDLDHAPVRHDYGLEKP